MGEFNIAAQSFPVWKAILWCFYPVSALVAIEYFLRLVDDDDDDDCLLYTSPSPRDLSTSRMPSSA